jgi:segregation and condensation protein B
VERNEIKAIAENILLVSDQPVTVNQLWETMQGRVEKDGLREALLELKGDYENRNIQILEVAEGFQICTRGEFGDWVKKFLKLDKTSKLTQPAFDTLSIIAYKQPLTRAEVDEIRGVDSGGVIKTLLEKKVISPAGRKKVPGRPVMYQTTRKFLEYFGLKDLSDLPTLEDFKETDLAELPHQTNLPFGEREDNSADHVETLPLASPAVSSESAKTDVD